MGINVRAKRIHVLSPQDFVLCRHFFTAFDYMLKSLLLFQLGKQLSPSQTARFNITKKSLYAETFSRLAYFICTSQNTELVKKNLNRAD